MDHDKLRPLIPDIDPLGYAAVAQAVGSTIWRIQQLEEAVRDYLVARFAFDRTIAADVAETMLERSRKKTLGQLVRELNTTANVPDVLSSRLSAFVDSRNWLVHHSQAAFRKALTTRAGRETILSKLDQIDIEAGAILHVLAEDLEGERRRRGFTDEQLLENAKATLRARYGA